MVFFSPKLARKRREAVSKERPNCRTDEKQQRVSGKSFRPTLSPHTHAPLQRTFNIGGGAAPTRGGDAPGTSEISQITLTHL